MVDGLLLLMALVSFVMSIYGFGACVFRILQASREFDPRLRKWANFFPDLTLLRGAYSEKGRRYFDLAVRNFMIFVLGGAVFAFIVSM